MPKYVKFDLFRYQLLPISRNYQGDFYIGNTVEELLERKNQLFEEALRQATVTDPHSKAAVKVEAAQEDVMLLRVAVPRSIRRESREFEQELVEHWPSVLVAVFNDRNRQIVAVQRRTKEYRNPARMMRWLEKSLRPFLRKAQLTMAWEPIFNKRDFWAIVDHYRDKITEVEFELVTPNMASISDALNRDLKAFAKETNAVKTKLKLTSDSEAALDLRQDNEMLRGIVEYVANGGGNVKARVAGLKKIISTSHEPITVQVAELELEGNPKDVLQALGGLLG